MSEQDFIQIDEHTLWVEKAAQGIVDYIEDNGRVLGDSFEFEQIILKHVPDVTEIAELKGTNLQQANKISDLNLELKDVKFQLQQAYDECEATEARHAEFNE